jgi:hypothetical protein
LLTTETDAQRLERFTREQAHMLQYADAVVTEFTKSTPETLMHGEDALKLPVR